MEPQEPPFNLTIVAAALASPSPPIAEPKQVAPSLSTLPTELKLEVIQLVALDSNASETHEGCLFKDGADKELKDPTKVVLEWDACEPSSDVQSLSWVNRELYTLCAPWTWQSVLVPKPVKFFFTRRLFVLHPKQLGAYVWHLAIDYTGLEEPPGVVQVVDEILSRFTSLLSLSLAFRGESLPLLHPPSLTKLRLSAENGELDLAPLLHHFSDTLEVLVVDNYDVPAFPEPETLHLPHLTHLSLKLGYNAPIALSPFAACPLTHFSFKQVKPSQLPGLCEFLPSLGATLRRLEPDEVITVVGNEPAFEVEVELDLIEAWCQQHQVTITLPIVDSLDGDALEELVEPTMEDLCKDLFGEEEVSKEEYLRFWSQEREGRLGGTPWSSLLGEPEAA
ncbi:hypothetical protein JCM6882_008054 [Rhodosporidiobolus microsporus]